MGVGDIVTVINVDNYKASYSEEVPFRAKVIDMYDINILVVSKDTGKEYELYEHQITK